MMPMISNLLNKLYLFNRPAIQIPDVLISFVEQRLNLIGLDPLGGEHRLDLLLAWEVPVEPGAQVGIVLIGFLEWLQILGIEGGDELGDFGGDGGSLGLVQGENVVQLAFNGEEDVGNDHLLIHDFELNR